MLKKIKKKYFIITIAIILIIILSVIFLLNKSSRYIKQNNIDKYNVEKPVFRKDGELLFISSDNNEVIIKIDIEIADTYESRMQGLMYRDTMAMNQGMLFIFETEEPQSFWMKDTYIPLDIIFVNSNRKIVKIQPENKILSQTSILSIKPALYVIEVNAGFCKKYNIKEGDIISFK